MAVHEAVAGRDDEGRAILAGEGIHTRGREKGVVMSVWCDGCGDATDTRGWMDRWMDGFGWG